MINDFSGDEIEMVLDSMKPVCKMVVLLRHGKGLQMTEITELMRYKTVNQVCRIHREGMRHLFHYFYPDRDSYHFRNMPFSRKLDLYGRQRN